MVLVGAPKKDDRKKQIEKIIDKGGRSAKDSSKDGWTMITVRIPTILLKEMDIQTEKRFGLSRNAWILESFQQKLNI